MKSLLTISLFGLLFLGTALSAQAQQTEEKNDKDASQKITLNIEGMACNMCEKRLNNALKKLDGVKRVEKVDAEEGAATLWIVEGKTVTDEKLKKTVENAGFKLKKVNRHPDDGGLDDTR